MTSDTTSTDSSHIPFHDASSTKVKGVRHIVTANPVTKAEPQIEAFTSVYELSTVHAGILQVMSRSDISTINPFELTDAALFPEWYSSFKVKFLAFSP